MPQSMRALNIGKPNRQSFRPREIPGTKSAAGDECADETLALTRRLVDARGVFHCRHMAARILRRTQRIR